MKFECFVLLFNVEVHSLSLYKQLIFFKLLAFSYMETCISLQHYWRSYFPFWLKKIT